MRRTPFIYKDTLVHVYKETYIQRDIYTKRHIYKETYIQRDIYTKTHSFMCKMHMCYAQVNRDLYTSRKSSVYM